MSRRRLAKHEQPIEQQGQPERRRVFSDEQAESLARAYVYLLQLAKEREEQESLRRLD